MSVWAICFLVLGIVDLFMGLMSLLKGKPFLSGFDAEPYTEASLKQYARVLGISNLISGAGMLAYAFTVETRYDTIGIAALAVVVIVSTIVGLRGKKVLVNK